MLKSIYVCLCLFSMPAVAAEWRFEADQTPIAYFDNGDAQFQFACRGGDLAMAYWVRKPETTVAAAATLSLGMTATGAAVSSGGDTKFAQDLPLIHSDGSSVIVRGPVAMQWARIAQRAKDTIHLAFVRAKPAGGMDFLDRQAFGAKGSSFAISKVLDRCG